MITEDREWYATDDEHAGMVLCVACQLFGRYVEAEYVTIDQDNLCADCTRESGAEVMFAL